jgi:hypothetical protein
MEVVFLHHVRFEGHVRRSGASRAQNVDALFFMLVRARCGSQIMRRGTLRPTCVFPSSGICGSRSAFYCVQGAKHQSTIFHAQVVPV